MHIGMDVLYGNMRGGGGLGIQVYRYGWILCEQERPSNPDYDQLGVSD